MAYSPSSHRRKVVHFCSGAAVHFYSALDTMAVAQATAERTGNADFSVAEIEDARWGQGLGSQAQDEAVKSIIRILDDPARLQDRLLAFSDSIFAAMESRKTST